MAIAIETRFSARLRGLFVQVEPQFRADTIARYKAAAEGDYAAWNKLLTGPKPEKTRTMFGSILAPSKYVKHSGGSYSVQWDWLVASYARGEWSCDLKRAKQDAIAAVDYAREHFIAKQTKKLTNATRLRTDRPTIAGKLRYQVLIEGVLAIGYPNGDGFEVVMSMIVNHRHERGYTSFYQFPARFRNVAIGGKMVCTKISEKWMSENFGKVGA